MVAKENPLKYLHSVPSLVGKLGRWLVLLTEFDIEYLISKVIKGRAVAEFLTLQPVEGVCINLSSQMKRSKLLQSKAGRCTLTGQ